MAAVPLHDLAQRIFASGPLLYIGAVMVTDARAFVRILHSIGPALRAFPFGKPEEPREPGPLATAIARVSGVALTSVALLTLTGLLS